MENRETWLWMLTIVSVAVVVLVAIVGAFDLAESGKVGQRAKIEVCKTFTDDGLRALCLERTKP